MSCDPKSKKHVDVKNKVIIINRSDFNTFALDAVVTYIEYFDIVKKYMSLWVKYVLIIEPTSDITLDDFDGQSELLEGRSQRCQAYLNKFKEGETKDVLKNQDCVDIAQLYSTEMFR